MTTIFPAIIAEQHPAEYGLSADLFSRWVEFIDAKPKTIDTYKKAIRQFFSFLLENDISHPLREDIIAYREYLTAQKKPTTVQNYLAAVKLFFQWTEQEGIYPNIAKRVKGVRIEPGHKKDYLTSSQAARLLNSIDRSTVVGIRDYAILSLMLTTGLRTISVVRANVQDLSTLGDDVILFHQGKGKDERADYVKLAAPVEEAIQKYLKYRGDLDGRAPLFASAANRNTGGRLTTRSVSRIAKTHLIGAALKSDRLTAHSLRHTAATLNLLNGGTVEETQQMLNHKSINTTMIYSHALERAKNNSEQRIADAIFK